MHYKSLDPDYAVSGQIYPLEIPEVAAAGFRSIVCARPDNEDNGQPSFADVAREAERAGLQMVHVPVSGTLSQGAFLKFDEAMRTIPRPALGYCRSGGRAASLYALYKRA